MKKIFQKNVQYSINFHNFDHQQVKVELIKYIIMDFKNLLEVTTYFADKANATAYLAKLRWDGNVKCIHCGHDHVYELKGATKRYKCADCRKQFSVTKGTIFEKSPVSLQKWFVAMYLLTSHKKGISSCQLAKDISVSQKTAWFMLHRIRYVVQTGSFSKNVSATYEADATYIGAKAKNKHAKERKALAEQYGRGTGGKVAVFGVFDRTGDLVAMKVENESGIIVKPIIRDVVGEDAIIVTDAHGGYKDLNFEMNHVVVNHQEGEYVKGEFHTNGIEGFWSQLKRGIYGIYHHVSPDHLDAYVDEFEYKWNTRKQSEVERFQNIIALGGHKRLTYKQLTA